MSTDPRKEQLEKDLFVIIHQFLEENGFRETANNWLEESKMYFDQDYFDSLIRNGDLERASKYTLRWMSWEGDNFEKRFIFTIMRQMYLEALGRKDYQKAVRMLYHDLLPLKTQKQDMWQQLFDLLGLDDFRQHEKLAGYTTDQQHREIMIADLRSKIEDKPEWKAKCKKPKPGSVPPQRLRGLINQALNWQHSRCGVKDTDWFTSVTTLITDHKCAPSLSNNNNAEPAQVSPPQYKSKPVEDGHANGVKRARDTPVVSPPPKQAKHDLPASPALSPIQSPPITPRAEETARAPSVPSTPSTAAPSEITSPPRLTRSQAVALLPVNDVTYIGLSSPSTAVRFHPINSTVLYVATADSQIQVWAVSQSNLLQTVTVSTPIKQMVVSGDGSYLAASTQSKILIFTIQPNNTLVKQHVITDHEAEVNDIKFIGIKDMWHVASCSDDKSILITNAVKGEKAVQFLGHTGPVTAVAAGAIGRTVFFCSSSKDSTIRVWMLSNPKPVSSLTSPSSKWYTDLCVLEDKLLGCGVAKDLLEWNTSGGNVSRHFRQYNNTSESSAIKFDLLSKRFLALSDDSVCIKFWMVTDEELLQTFDPEILGSSSSYLSISGNSNGSLLAIGSPVVNYIKITGNQEGIRMVAKKLTKQDVKQPAENNNNVAAPVPATKSVLPPVVTANLTTAQRPAKPSVQIPVVPAAHSPQVASPAPVTSSPLFTVTTVPISQASPPVTPTVPSPPMASSSPMAANIPALIPVPSPIIPMQPTSVTIPSANPYNMLSVKAEAEPESPIHQLVFQYNGSGLITFGDGAIRLWKWPNGAQANTMAKPELFSTPNGKSMNPPLSTGPRFYSMALTSNDVYLMASCGNGVSLFHTTKLSDFGHTTPGLSFYAMALNTKDNNYLATIAADAIRIHAFGYNPGVVLEERSTFTSKGTSIAFHNNFIAAGSEEGVLVMHKFSVAESEKVAPAGKVYTVKTFAIVESKSLDLKHSIVGISVNKTNNILLVATKRSLVFVQAPERVVYTWDSTFASNIVCATFNMDYTLIFCVLEDNTRLVLRIQDNTENPQNLIVLKNQALDMKHGAIRSIAAHTKNPHTFAVGTQKGFFCICEFDPNRN